MTDEPKHASCGLHADCVTGRKRTEAEQADYDRRAGITPEQTIGDVAALERAVSTLVEAHEQGLLTESDRARIAEVLRKADAARAEREGKQPTIHRWCAKCGSPKKADANYVDDCRLPGNVFSFCANCGGPKEPNRNFVHEQCLCRDRPKSDLVRVFHERTGRCLGTSMNHADCARIQAEHETGKHEDCLIAECTEPMDRIQQAEQQRARAEAESLTRGVLSERERAFYAPPPPLTLEQRVERLEAAVAALSARREFDPRDLER